MKKSLIAAALLGSSIAPTAAIAQDVPAAVAELIATGATVYGSDGNEVGKIEDKTDANVTIFTGTNRATLPATSLGRGDKGLLIAMTKAQLDAAVEAATAKTNEAMAAALIPEAVVKGSDGVDVGKVQKVDGDLVTLQLPTDTSIALPKNQFQIASNGLSLFMTSGEFADAVKAATAPK